MCKCNRQIKMPFCGAPGCEWPRAEPARSPWIEAADKAGTLSDEATDFLACHLVPDGKGNLITLPAATWQGMWRLMHLVRARLPLHPDAI